MRLTWAAAMSGWLVCQACGSPSSDLFGSGGGENGPRGGSSSGGTSGGTTTTGGVATGGAVSTGGSGGTSESSGGTNGTEAGQPASGGMTDGGSATTGGEPVGGETGVGGVGESGAPALGGEGGAIAGGAGGDPGLVVVELTLPDELQDCVDLHCPEEAPYVIGCDFELANIMRGEVCVAIESDGGLETAFIVDGRSCDLDAMGTSEVAGGTVVCASEPSDLPVEDFCTFFTPELDPDVELEPRFFTNRCDCAEIDGMAVEIDGC